MKPGPAVFTTEILPKVTTLSGCDVRRPTVKELSQDKVEAMECAERIAVRYEVEAQGEQRPAYKANFQRIAASYRQLAKDLAQ